MVCPTPMFTCGYVSLPTNVARCMFRLPSRLLGRRDMALHVGTTDGMYCSGALKFTGNSARGANAFSMQFRRMTVGCGGWYLGAFPSVSKFY